MSREKKDADRVTLLLRKDLSDWLKTYAKENDLTQTAAIERAIRYLKNAEAQK